MLTDAALSGVHSIEARRHPPEPSPMHHRKTTLIKQSSIYPKSSNQFQPATSNSISNVSSMATEPRSPSSLVQPTTRPISEQQLINEVKGIYAGLVMVERKCVDIIHQQNQSTKYLSDQQWKALVALHRTLLQEHHDFFSASQHPSASDSLKKLAIKYAMPARMWRHGIHAFLELLRHRLPDSMEHMLSFIYLAYSMMALLKESMPGFVETWIECLGDLARYRMAIEDSDHKDRETWSNMAKMWYNGAADKSPNVGRIQQHLAVLARPSFLEQLFYYGKALLMLETSFETPRTQPHSRRADPSRWILVRKSRGTRTIHDDGTGAQPPSRTSGCNGGTVRLAQETVNSENPMFGSPGHEVDQQRVRHRKPWFHMLSALHKIRFAIWMTIFMGWTAPVLAQPDGDDDAGNHLISPAEDGTIQIVRTALLWLFFGFNTMTIPIIGSKCGLDNDIGASIILAFIFALLRGLTGDQVFPTFWSALSSGASLGCSFWLARTTMSHRNSVLVHCVRYVTPAYLLYYYLWSSDFADQSRHFKLSAMFPDLSVLGSVCVNALINEKAIEAREKLSSIWRWILANMGLRQLRPDELV